MNFSQVVGPRTGHPWHDTIPYTSFQGHVIATYQRLVEVFGVPDLMPSSNGEITTRWVIRWEDDLVATIHDYRATNCYDHALPSPEEFRELCNVAEGHEWRVTGTASGALARVQEAIAGGRCTVVVDAVGGVLAQMHEAIENGEVHMRKFAIEDLRQADESQAGFCIACGAMRDGCEPDARAYDCEECGKPQVYGAQEIMLMGLVE